MSGQTFHNQSLTEFLQRHQPVTVLTGAGCSTASGIPDYRDQNGDWKQRLPIQYQEFIASHAARQRYWQRSMLGWSRFSAARPNRIHRGLVALEQAGIINAVITQNVDGLHTRAGQSEVVELHGSLATVRCLQCDARQSRKQFQIWLTEKNEAVFQTVEAEGVTLQADGDVDYEPASDAPFQYPDCPECHGILKPDVVFFGEVVPVGRVNRAFELINESGALLVLGSSLMVFSGFRFSRHAHENDFPQAIVNRGVTRADNLNVTKIDADCGVVLSHLCDQLLGLTL